LSGLEELCKYGRRSEICFWSVIRETPFQRPVIVALVTASMGTLKAINQYNGINQAFSTIGQFAPSRQ
jgi:hypothetical protein